MATTWFNRPIEQAEEEDHGLIAVAVISHTVLSTPILLKAGELEGDGIVYLILLEIFNKIYFLWHNYIT